MTAEDKELLSEKVVALCHAAGRYGYPEDRLLRALDRSNFKLTPDDLEKELKYLRGKQWIEEAEKDLRPDRRHWISTAKGDEFLMQCGLI